MRDYDATIFTIATGKYLDYFALQLPQIAQHYAPGKSVQVIVATDRTDNLPVSNEPRVTVQYVESPSYNWPEITLLRYEQILSHRHLIKGRTLMWLDTDMKFLQDIPFELVVGDGDAPNFARHPGYVWDKNKVAWLNPIRLARQVTPWVRSLCRGQIGAGTWETNKESMAYVAPWKRRNYAHGAVWGGLTHHTIEMVEVLAKRTRSDYDRGLVAIWHDESHLNWYVANHNMHPFPIGFSAWNKTWQFNEAQSFLNSLDKSQLDSELDKSGAI